MERLKSLQQYLKDLDVEIGEAEHDVEGHKDWDAGAAVRQTLRMLKVKRLKREHELRLEGACRVCSFIITRVVVEDHPLQLLCAYSH